MDISVPSRFACLKIEEDEFRTGSSKKKVDNKQNKKGGNTAKEAPKGSFDGNNLARKKGGITGPVNEKSKTASKKAKKAREGLEKEWEEWQKKDSKFVNEVFEEQMQNAIMQSKLEFEQQKKTVVIKTDPEPNHGKKKKGKTMRLDEFLESNKETESKEKAEDSPPKFDEKDFFQEVFESTKKAITKDNVEQNRRKRQEAFEEVVSLAQCQEKLESERSKNARLIKKLEEAREEIALVKKRNTTLCSMLSHGEMKDKAELLRELDRLTLVKEELTEEVANLHKLLEQERSHKNTQHGVTAPENHLSKHGKEKTKKKKH